MQNGSQYTCEGRNSIDPLSNGGAVFFWAHTIVQLSFSVVVLFVYYFIPASYGMIVKTRQTKIKGLTNKNTISKNRPSTVNIANATAELVI